MFKAIVPNQSEEGIILVRGVPFGGPQNRDIHGQFFTSRTNFLPHVLPLPPVFHFHGAKTGSLSQEVGETLGREQRNDGVWYKAKLFIDSTVDEVKEKAVQLWEAAKNGDLFASSGAVEATIKIAESGEILQWLVGELSLLDIKNRRENPASFHATVTPVKADLAAIETGDVTLDQLNIEDSDDPATNPTQEGNNATLKETIISALSEIFGADMTPRSLKMADENNDLLAQMQAQMAQMQAQMAEMTTNNATLQTELQTRDGQIAELQGIVSTKSAEVAMGAHTGMVDDWIKQGKLSPSERDPMLEVLSFAYQADTSTKGDVGFVNSIKGLIEARPVNPTVGNPAAVYSNAGNLNGGHTGPGGGVDPDNLARLKRYAEIAE